MKKLVFLGLAVLALVLLVLFLLQGGIEVLLGGGGVYKTVNLTNGTSYIGKVKDQNANFVTLTDVFYLRVKATDDPKVATLPASRRDLELVKLGGEVYGPEDAMTINRRQIISLQGLKADSPVVKAIRQYYGGKGPSSPAGKSGKVEVKAQ